MARLELRGISKTFGPNRVLSGVDLTVGPGEIRGLAGQNGSGKSTLIKILTGVYAPDPGARISVDGTALGTPVRWQAAHAAGVSVVHQDLGLLDHLTVAENICVGGFPTTRMGRIDRSACDRISATTLSRLGVDLDPATYVGELSAAQRAEVAIARALRDHAPGQGLMILDESTRALRGSDLDRVHGMLRQMVAGGSSVIMISHSLHELASLSDCVTVLRDGRVVADLDAAAGLPEHEIARAMLGDSVTRFDRAGKQAADERPRIVVQGMAGQHARDITFSIGAGEIVGITGVPGSGYEEIPALVAGGARTTAGMLHVDNANVDLARFSVSRAMRSGVVLVPERRDRDGLALELTVQDNVTLPRLRRLRRSFFLSRTWRAIEGRRAIDEHGIRPANPHALARQLSGGNQQKVLLAKWMAMRPKLLVLHEPTQAVDVGARQDILHKIADITQDGTGVLIVSSEADDLTAICDRVLIYQADGGLTPGDSDDADTLLEQVFTTPAPHMTGQ
ncbi:sugar ABC transporter ATP-binding protein [Streptomyces luteolifulvus]|uniref:Sugar ABC transporter ATP-binding protein n=1 Tax=Streptomyces luteolifulvus TaxID=2615112 RepID=A0A6H9UPN8_9ACTN|nr:sugar ABC transporter ATP-binding protein [Streptomyces luteolifulvus]KAB1139347.1 sugar ABC transporter ATP-binding protein [Streptomyces luteolifulvus]